jgi:L-ascorbate metabolism protein UlaG (beta-lactamase superfamily)
MQDNNNVSAHIWYLFHSGFAVKTTEHFLVFDYYLDSPKGAKASLESGVIKPEKIRDHDVVVFSSHQHHDHFNPVIFTWRNNIRKIRYVLSSDIGHSKEESIISVEPGRSYELGDLNIKVLDSTDIGSAFLVEVDGLTIYHGGDLHWWHWKGEPDSDNLAMAESYKKQIDMLKGKSIDIAFIPLDPRLEEYYLLGLDYFMRAVGANMVFPMHFGKEHDIFMQLREERTAADYMEKVAEIRHRGQQFVYKK